MPSKQKDSPFRQEIESILQRLRRSKEPSSAPNQAQLSMGRRLGTAFLNALDEEIGQEIMKILISSSSSSVSHGYFESLRSADKHPAAVWIAGWIQTAQQAEAHETLSAILYYYAWHSRQAALSGQLDGNRIAQVYSQLSSRTTRPVFVDAFVTHAFGEPLLLRPLLSPLMAASILSLLTPLVERTMLLEQLYQACWKCARKQQLSLDTLSWFAEYLVMLLDGIDGDDPLVLDMAHHWLSQIADMLVCIPPNSEGLTVLLSDIITVIMPRFFESLLTRSMTRIVESLVEIAPKCTLSDAATMQLATLALSTPISVDARTMLTLLLKCSSKSLPIPRLLANIFGQDEQCEAIAFQLQSVLWKQSDAKSGVAILGLERQDQSPFLLIAANALSKVEVREVNVLAQNSFLLLTCCLLMVGAWDESTQTFVTSLLQKFPHLAIPLLPVLLDLIQQTNDGTTFVQRLDFLCQAVVHEPHCATEVWNLVGLTLSQKDQPLSVRLAAIRMYSTLCANNRRLYRRIVDSLGNFVNERQLEIRLAVVSVICRLAEQDLIRDVSDVIGWIQTFLQVDISSFLQDEGSTVSHLAVMTLHHLVVNEELDFDLTIKVLGKRLCAVGDVKQVLKQPPLVIEALVVLLGDGQAGTEGGEAISPQGSVAIDTLIALANTKLLDGIETATAKRISSGIVQSLSNYSPEALGLEEESIKILPAVEGEAVIPEASRRYKALSALCSRGILAPGSADLSSFEVTAGAQWADSLATKIIFQEEEHLGASIWQKGHKMPVDTKGSNRPGSKKASKSALSALPSPGSIFGLYDDQPSAATSIASLLTFGGNDIEHLADFASDLSQEGSLSPILFTFSIQGWLNAMARVWDSISTNNSSASLDEAVQEVVTKIRNFSVAGVDADFVFLALSCFTIHLPDAFELADGSGAKVEFSQAIGIILKDTEDAFMGHNFTNVEIGHVCLSLAATRSLHLGDNQTFTRILALLHKAAEDETSLSTGLFFGFAFIARSIPIGNAWAQTQIGADRKQRKAWAGLILSMHLQQLGLCLDKSVQAIITFAASLASVSVTPGLDESLRDMAALTIHISAATKVKSLLMSLAGSLSCLSGIEPAFVNSFFLLMRQFPVGSGREFVMTSILSNPELRCHVKPEDWLESDASDDATTAYLLGTLDSDKEDPNSWFERNRSRLRGDSLVDIVMMIGTLPVLAQRETSPFVPPKLLPHISVRDIVSVLEILNEDVSEMSIVIKGLLASMTLPQLKNVGVLASAPNTQQNPKSRSVEASKLPTPHQGTLLFTVVTAIRELFDQGDENAATLVRLLGYLEPLSLPANFATALIDPLIFSKEASLQMAAVKLLVSQFTGRRRATFEGKDFIALASRVATVQDTTLLKNGGCEIYGGMTDLLRRCSTDSIETIVTQSWENCVAAVTELQDTSFVHKWLEGIKSLLIEINTNQSLSLSPRTISIVRVFVVKNCFTSLAELSLVQNVDGAFDLLTQCLIEIPVQRKEGFVLMDSNADFTATLWRVRCTAVIVDASLEDDKEGKFSTISSMVAWMSKQQLDTESAGRTRKIYLLAAAATKSLGVKNQFQVIALLLESMLVQEPTSLALHLFALLLNAWEGDYRQLTCLAVADISVLPQLTDVSLEEIAQQILQELPKNVGSFAHRSKSGRVISNRLLQTIKAWKQKDAPGEVLNLLLRMVNRCKSKDTPENEMIAASS